MRPTFASHDAIFEGKWPKVAVLGPDFMKMQ
jgi:hypothetical protein